MGKILLGYGVGNRIHSQALSPELKEELEDYLRRLTKGREEEEAWRRGRFFRGPGAVGGCGQG